MDASIPSVKSNEIQNIVARYELFHFGYESSDLIANKPKVLTFLSFLIITKDKTVIDHHIFSGKNPK